MNAIINILSERIIDTLGWTIVHTLWQGAAIALGVAVLLLFMRKASARSRYLVGLLALCTVFLVSAVTFVSLYQATPAGGTLSALSEPAAIAAKDGAAMASENGAVEGLFPSITAFFKYYFQQHLPLIVTVWLMGILFLTLRFAGGVLYNRNIKQRHSAPLPSWQKRLNEIGKKLGVSKPVRLLESALVKVPVAMGLVKPVIMLPVGMVTGLPREQVEALLAHELAHILRRDYLANILQNAVDILFFYHPGIRWISAMVRSERENCCDDLAVRCTGDSLIFAKALTNIQAAVTRQPEPAMAATGRKYRLLNRVKRLLTPTQTHSRMMERFAGTMLTLFLLLTLVVGVNAATAGNLSPIIQKKAQKQEKPQKVEKTKPAKEKKEKKEKKQAREEEEAMEAAQAREAKEAQEEMQAMEAEQAREEERAREVEQEMEAQQAREAEEIQELEREKAVQYKKQEELTKTLSAIEKELLKNNREKDILRDKQQKRLALLKEALQKKEQEIHESQKGAEKEKALKKLMKEYAKKNAQMLEEEKKIAHQLAKQKAELVKKLEALKRSRHREIEMLKNEAKRREDLERREAEKELMKREKEQELIKHKEIEHKKKELLKQISKQLMRDKLITRPDRYKFILTTDELFINGIRQPQSVFEKYNQMLISQGIKIKKSRKFSIIRN